MITVTRLRFNTNELQKIRTMGGEEIWQPAGKCPRCERRMYEPADGSGGDPRGVAGTRIPYPFHAGDFGMIGPDFVVCWGCRSESGGDVYRALLKKAKATWRTLEEVAQ